MTSAEMDVPGIGNVKRQYVYAGGALVAGIAGYAWWKQRGTSSSTAPVLNPNDVVPATDYQGAATGDATQTVDSTGGAITTNAQWTQKATELMASYGFDPILASTALGKFLTRSGLSASEIEVVQRAVGLLGYPPVGGPYSMIPASTTTTPPPANTPPPSGARGNVSPGTNANIQLAIGANDHHLVMSTGYGRRVVIHQIDYWGASPATGKTGVGGGSGQFNLDPDRPFNGTIPRGAVMVSIRYTAAEPFDAEIVS